MLALTLAITAFTMGVVGGPHCVLMCGAACAGVSNASPRRPAVALATFLAGRATGYAALGAVAALSMQSVAWLSTQTVMARPLWTMLHAAAAVVGLLLILSGRQPPWLEVLAKRVWQRIIGLVRQNGLKGAGLLGAAWAFMPCGLLYSALMVASLTDTWASGATYMALFALGSSLSLLAGPWLLLKLAQYRHREIGVRLAGVALLLMAGSTLWMGLVHQQAPWCTPV